MARTACLSWHASIRLPEGEAWPEEMLGLREFQGHLLTVLGKVTHR